MVRHESDPIVQLQSDSKWRLWNKQTYESEKNHVISDPIADEIDEKLINLAYNDQQIDFDDNFNAIKSHVCCDGIYTGIITNDNDYNQLTTR